MNIPEPGVLVEVCVDSVASALAAERGGAARIELCSSLVEGGVTPSSGLIETTKAAVNIPVHVMIRPRGGDFYYDSFEFKAMQRDIAGAKRLGVAGVVFGILDANGNVDVTRSRQLLDIARPLAVTFHRAFDVSSDLFRSLEDLCTIGVDRVLTSGGERTCLSGQEKIAALVRGARGRIQVMPGGGIRPENARSLLDQIGAKEVHVGLRSALPSPMVHRNQSIMMGTVENHEYQRFVVLEEDVRRLCDNLARPAH